MTAKILKANGKYAYRLTLRGLYDYEKAYPVHIHLRKQFDRRVADNLGKKQKLDDFPDQEDIDTTHHDLYEYEHEGGVDTIPDRNDLGNQYFYNYLDAQVLPYFGEDQKTAKSKPRKREGNGKRMGQLHSNPILNTRLYDVEFPDGTEKKFTANIIAQNMYSQCDADGNQYLLMDATTDHKKDQMEIEKTNAVIVVNVRPQQQKTTKGWFFYILWKYRTTTWERFAEIKE